MNVYQFVCFVWDLIVLVPDHCFTFLLCTRKHIVGNGAIDFWLFRFVHGQNIQKIHTTFICNSNI